MYNRSYHNIYHIKKYANILVGVALSPLMSDEFPLGVITAYCPGSPNNNCPAFAGGSSTWVFASAGNS